MKNYFIKTLVVLILAFSIPSVSQAARTDGVWDNFGTYMKTVIPAGLDVLINGANHYLNFGSVSGTSGYGIRDNAGVIECKNSGGAWGACAGSGSGGGSGGGAWATNTPNTLTYLTTQWTALIGGTASTTIGNIFEVLGNGYFSGGLQSIRSTTTNATTTTFAVTGTATSTFGGAINSPCFFTNGGCLSTTTPGTGFSTTSADFWISATTSLPKLTDLGGLLRSTSTQATSTNLFSTTASTTALYLATGVCSGTNALTIGTDGKVVCGAITGSGGGTQFPTSTNPLMATYFVATGTATSTFKTAIEVGNGVATSTFIPGPGTSTPGGGINIPNNCYAIAGTCISGAIASVFGRIGVVVATAGDYTTAQVTEVTNLYFTNARAIAATLTGYVSGAGTITAADTVLSAIQKLNGNVGALVTGVSSVFGRTGAVVAQSGDYTTTQVTEGTNLYYTQTRFDNALTATTSLPKLTDLGGLLRSTTTQSTSTYLFATQASSSNLYLGNGSCASGQTLVINASGQVVCAAFVGGSAASSTLLTDQNTFSSASNTINFLNNIRSTTTQATTTSLAVSGVSSAIMLTNAGGSVSGYTGTTCTNQFVRILSALGVATCATVANTDLANSSLTISTAGGLLGGGTVSLGGTITITDPKQIATTTPTIGQLAYFTGVTPTSLGSVATNTVTCTGNATCATFTALASAPVTINVAAGTAASSTLLADNNTFSGINIFNNILRSTSTQSTSTNFFSQFAFIPQATVGVLTSTTTATSTFAGGIKIANWTLSTSTTVCLYPETCQFQTSGTSDHLQIQAALNLIGNAGGGRVHINAGLYKIGLRMPISSNTFVEGDGWGTILQPTGGSDTQTLVASGTNNIMVQNLAIDGSNQTGSVFNSDMSIKIKNAHNILVNNVLFSNTKGYAVDILSQSLANGGQLNASTTGITITNNVMYCNGLQDCVGGGPDQASFGLATTSNVTISNNHIYQKTFAGGVVGPSMDVNCMDLVAVQQLTFTGNDCQGNVLFGSEQTPNQYSMITNNIVDAPTGPVLAAGDIVVITNGIAFSALPSNLVISGNTIKRGKVLITGAGTNINQYVSITNNNITTSSSSDQNYNGVANNGIRLDTVQSSFVSGNTITAFLSPIVKSTAAGIFNTNTTNITVSNNQIKDFTVGVDMGSGSGNTSILNTHINNTTNEQNVTQMVNYASGNFGIGTTSAGSLLSLGGTANFTTGTSSFYGTGGMNIKSGCYAIAGTCIGGGSGTGASTTLLADNNTFSGSNTLQSLNFTNATGTNATTTSLFSTFLRATQGYFANLFVTGSSTLGSVTMGSATTSNATSTAFAITTIPSAILKTTASGSVIPAISGTDYQPAGSYESPLTFTQGSVRTGNTITSPFADWNKQTNFGVLNLTPTTTLPIWASGGLNASSTSNFVSLFAWASSTFQDFTARNATTTQATSTFTFATTASSTNLFSQAHQSGTLFVTGSSTLNAITFGVSTSTNATTTTEFSNISSSTYLFAQIAQFGTLFVTGSSTLNAVTMGSATTSNATTSALAISTIISCAGSNALQTTNGGSVICGAVTGGGGGAAYPFNPTLVNGVFQQATTSIMSSSGGYFSSSTISAFDALFIKNATTTNATSTNFYATLSSSTNLFAQSAQFGTLFATGSSTLNAVTMGNATSSSATSTNLYASNIITALGQLIVGTSTAVAKLAIQGAYGSTAALFDVASSTAANGTATSSLFRITPTNSTLGTLFGIGVPQGVQPFANLSVWGNYGLNAKPIVDIATTTTSGGATSSLFRINYDGKVAIASTTCATIFCLGTLNNVSTGSSTISAGKLQWDGYNTTGARICSYFVGTALIVQTGACTP